MAIAISGAFSGDFVAALRSWALSPRRRWQGWRPAKWWHRRMRAKSHAVAPMPAPIRRSARHRATRDWRRA
jgi:hypothetical protein